MPNWNYNSVDIHAPIEAVKAYLVPHKDDIYRFNMHLLFPDKIPASDPTGEVTWDYDWSVDKTGSKWFPEVNVSASEDGQDTYLSYDTARSPNNGTLQRLHEITGWAIENEYEEPGMQFTGTFDCLDGTCTDIAREYETTCEICEEKRPESEYDDEQDGLICNACRKAGPAS